MSECTYRASCVAIDGRAVLIAGPPGAGKSSLALALIDRGASLIGDDGVTLACKEDRLIASPPPNTAHLIEIRNLGIVNMPATAGFPVAISLRLDPAAPRHVEAAGTVNILERAIPAISLWPDTPVLPLRAEWALRVHGLQF